MAPSFIFPDLKYVNTLWLYLMEITSGKLKEKTSSDYPMTVNHMNSKIGEIDLRNAAFCYVILILLMKFRLCKSQIPYKESKFFNLVERLT